MQMSYDSSRLAYKYTNAHAALVCSLARKPCRLAGSIKSKQTSNSQTLHVLDADVSENLAGLRNTLLVLFPLPNALRLSACHRNVTTLFHVIGCRCNDERLALDIAARRISGRHTPAAFGADCSTWDWYKVQM